MGTGAGQIKTGSLCRSERIARYNRLLAIAADGHTHHATAAAWFERQETSCCALCRVTQTALLRHLAHSRIMGVNVSSQAEAWRTWDELRDDPRVVFLPEPIGLEAAFRRLPCAASPSHALWTDAYLAAFAMESRPQLVSFDRGFRRFDGPGLLLVGEQQPETQPPTGAP